MQKKKKMTGAEYEAHQKAFEAKKAAQQRAFASTSLHDVMDMMGYGSTAKSGGSRHIKYSVNGAVFNCMRDGDSFGIITGEVPSFMTIRPGKSGVGGSGALALYRAVNDLTGSAMSYGEACDSFAQKVCPETLSDKFKLTKEELREAAEQTKERKKQQLALQKEREEKRLSKKVSPEDLPAYNPAGEEMLFRYLTENREFSKEVAKQLMDSRVVYPALVEDSFGTRKFKNHHIISPSVDIETGEVFGYADITIRKDRNKEVDEYNVWQKTFAKNEGLFTDSVVPICAVTDKTKKICVSESVMDGIAYGALKGFPQDEAIVTTGGARIPHPVIRYCKKHGLELKTIPDNDIAGRIIATRTMEACRDAGVKCSFEIPSSGEILLNFDEKNPKSQERVEQVKQLADSHNFKCEEVWDEQSELFHLKVENNKTICRHLNDLKPELLKEKQVKELDLNKDKYPDGIPHGAKDTIKAPSSIQIEYYNKDWNDLLKFQNMQAELSAAGSSLESKALKELEASLRPPAMTI